MAELTREYIAQRFDQLRKLAREKRAAEALEVSPPQAKLLDLISQNNQEEKIVNLDGDVLPF